MSFLRRRAFCRACIRLMSGCSPSFLSATRLDEDVRRYQIFLPDGMTRSVNPLPSAIEYLFSRGFIAAIFFEERVVT